MSSLRQKLQAKFKGFGSKPPGWTSGDLGLASNNPSAVVREVGIGGFSSTGEDWLDDIYQVLRTAFRSKILYGLYGEPIKKGNNEIQFSMASDIASVYAPSRRIILAILASAESQGLISMPQNLKVETSGNVVRVRW